MTGAKASTRTQRTTDEGANESFRTTQRKDWLALVAVHGDAWLMAVAFYYGAKFDAKKRCVETHAARATKRRECGFFKRGKRPRRFATTDERRVTTTTTNSDALFTRINSVPTVYETLSAAHGREEKPTTMGARANGSASTNGRDATGKGAKNAVADAKGNVFKAKKQKVDPVRVKKAPGRANI